MEKIPSGCSMSKKMLLFPLTFRQICPAENEITTLLEGDGTQNTSIDLEKGTARIILVGDGTSGSCEITLSDISNVSVDSPSDGLDSEEWMDDFYNDWT